MKSLNILKAYMISNRMSLAVAESLTCGNVQALIGRVSGASGFFQGGLTAYNIDQKVKHLVVDRVHAASVDCVSEQVALEMAKGVTLLFNSDIGVGTTGYAEADNQDPMAFIAIYQKGKKGGEKVIRIQSNLRRVDMQRYAAVSALHALYEFLNIPFQRKHFSSYW